MLCRTRGRKLYVCRTHEACASECPQGWLDGDRIDAELSRFLLDMVVDVEATVANLARLAERELADAAELRADAERDAMRAEALAHRVREEWERGGDNAPSLAFVEEQIERYRRDAEAARARANRQAVREATLGHDALVVEAQRRARETLDAIRTNGGGDALRGLLPRLFERIVVGTVGARWGANVLERAAVVEVGANTLIAAIPRPEAARLESAYIVLGPRAGEKLPVMKFERSPLFGDSEVFSNQLTPNASTPSSRRRNFTAPPGPAPSTALMSSIE
jgi:hypothetical protein